MIDKEKKRIGFCHNYSKLYCQTKARLVEVAYKLRCDIDEIAIAYDTRYAYSKEGGTWVAHCPLEDGEYLRLLLMGNKGIPFTTYRKRTAENEAKYCNAIGEWFEIYVKEQFND